MPGCDRVQVARSSAARWLILRSHPTTALAQNGTAALRTRPKSRHHPSFRGTPWRSRLRRGNMDDIERPDDDDGEDYDEQIEQMIIENGILLHSLAALLVRKGILKQEELDGEMDRLYDEMENFDQQ